MKKRIASVLLMLVMVLSLAGCEKGILSGKTSAADVLNKIRNTQVNSAQLFLSVDASDNGSADLRFDMYGDGDSNAYIEIYAKFDIDGYVLDDYALVTDLYVINGDTAYLDISQFKKFLVKVDSQFSVFTAIFTFPGDYLIINKESYEEAATQLDLDDYVDTDEVLELSKTDIDTLIANIGEIIDTVADACEEGTIVIDSDSISCKLDYAGIVNVCEALLNIDFEKYMTQEEKEGYSEGELNANIYDSISEYIDDIKEAAQENGDATLDFYIGSDGENVTAKINAGVTADASDASSIQDLITVSYSTGKDTTQIEAPASTMTIEEFSDVISLLFGAYLN